MSVLIIALAVAAGCLLFLGGFYTGVWIQRHSVTTVEVPKIVQTEKVVEVEVPKLIEVPMPAKKEGAGLVIMGQDQRQPLNPGEQAESQRMKTLLGGNPEYGS